MARVEAESDTTCEATVSCRSAYAAAASATKALATGRRIAKRATPKPLTGLRVLAIDDQEDSRELVALVLEDAGAIVTQADSVATALKALHEGEFGVIVSDIGMPGEDGYALLSRLRARESSLAVPSLPALALTAYASPDDRRKALAAGFHEHAAKPIDPARLVDIVARLVRR